MAEPILKWAGGKRQILDRILPRLPNNYDRYFEPFFGGGAVFFALEPENGFINDINPRLMNFYRQVRQDPEEIIARNRRLDREHDNLDSKEEQQDFYYKRRDEFNRLRADGTCEDELKEAVLFLYLNRSCWNGLYRTNEEGEFNVPIGSKQTPVTAIVSKIRRGHRALQSTKISSEDFGYIRDVVDENDLVFLDPPYPVESKTAKFNKYFEGRFEDENQERVRDLAIEFHERGVHVLVTNGPSAMRLYQQDNLPDAFRIQEISGQRNINSNASKRTGIGTTDIVVTNISSFDVQKTFEDFR